MTCQINLYPPLYCFARSLSSTAFMRYVLHTTVVFVFFAESCGRVQSIECWKQFAKAFHDILLLYETYWFPRKPVRTQSARGDG